MKRNWINRLIIILFALGWQQSNAQSCTACFTATQDTLSPYSYNLNASCSNPPSFSATFEWIIDGQSWGLFPFAYLQASFNTPGTHTIALIFSDNGCIDSTSQTVTIIPSCDATFTGLSWGNGAAYFYRNSALGNGNYTWDFGDGSTSSQNAAYVNHQYATGGTYNVCCIYTDTLYNCSDTFCAPIVISSFTNNVACNLNMNVSAVPAWNDLVIDASASSYTWNTSVFEFYINGTQYYSGTSPNYYIPFLPSGVYTVTGLLYDTIGSLCDADSQVVVIIGNGGGGGNTACNACFFYNYLTTDSFMFDASCSYNPGGTYQWSVDGAPYVTGPSIWSQAFTIGSHTIALQLIDSTGGVCDSTYDYIYVSAPPCTTCLNINPVPGTTSDYTFDVSCTGNVANVIWYVDGNYVSATTSPTFNYSFTNSGTYTVCAQTVDSIGGYCSQACSTISVTTTPATSFDINGTVYQYNLNNWGYYNAVGNNEAKVYLITLQPGGQLDAVDSTYTNAWGQYSFQNKIVQDYRIKVALESTSPNYLYNIPTYYTSATMWYDATVVTLFNNLYGKDIYMIPGTNASGAGFISGNVFAGANKPSRNVDRTQVTVMLVDAATNKPVMYTKPNINGDYSFNNIPTGQYKIMGELLNRSSIPETINITSSNNNFSGKNFMFNDNVVVPTNLALSIKNTQPTLQTNLQVTPNPALNNFSIATTATDGKINVYDVTGKTVISKDMKGKNTITIDCSTWQAGIYLVEQITAGGKTMQKMTKQ